MRAPSTMTTCAQSTPCPSSSRRPRSPQALRGSAETQATRAPRRAAAAATFASAPPICTSRSRAFSRRPGGGTASRRRTSPTVTRSYTSDGAEADRERGAKDHGARDRLRTAVGTKHDGGGTARTGPRREWREVERRGGLLRAGFSALVRLSLELEHHRSQLTFVRPLHIVGSLIIAAPAAHHERPIHVTGPGRPPAVRIIQHGTDGIVHVIGSGQLQHVVQNAFTPAKECHAAGLDLDPVRVGFVPDFRA